MTVPVPAPGVIWFTVPAGVVVDVLGVVILGVAPAPPNVLGVVVVGDVVVTSDVVPEVGGTVGTTGAGFVMLGAVTGFAVFGVPPVAGGVTIVAPDGVTVVTLPTGAVTGLAGA